MARRHFTFWDRTTGLDVATTDLTVELLRSFGHSQPTAAIREAITPIIEWQSRHGQNTDNP
ncbi:MAG: hypothetical protein J0L64_11105 [Acidobacteria bacterium]|nr:hypothetical protein [Acidobacteriota bacterium]